MKITLKPDLNDYDLKIQSTGPIGRAYVNCVAGHRARAIICIQFAIILVIATSNLIAHFKNNI